jgi:hypothetical protein
MDSDEDEITTLQAAKARATEFKLKRLSAGTRRTYFNYQAQFVEWFLDNHPELVEFRRKDDSDELKPFVQLEKLEYEIFEEFICDVKSKKTKSYLSVSALQTMRSAVKSLYIDQNLAVPAFWDLDLSTLYKGIKKNEAKNKRFGEIVEGKSHFSFTLYCWIMEFLMTQGGRKAPFNHLFGILCWNLICRGDNTASISFHHISWEQDAMVFKFSQAKNDQTGERISAEKKHVYSNPIRPFLCPVLSLAVYLATTSFEENEKMLFPGSGQKERMLASMQMALQSEKAQYFLKDIGKTPKDFGNHSFRKGATTYATSGSVGGPSGFSVLLRGGWNLGGVISRYLKIECAGDQFVGRVLAGLPLDDPQFAVVPPSFLQINEAVREAVFRMFGHCEIFENPKEVLFYCLASLLYHSTYILSEFPKNHPIFNTYIFANINHLNTLKPLLDVSENRIQATGVPPHVSILRALENLSNQKQDILEGVQEILAKHGALAPHATAAQLEQLESRIMKTIESAICSREIRNSEDERHKTPAASRIPSPFYWGGKFRKVPQNFVIPSCSVESAFQLWINGNPSRQELPYRNLDATDLPVFSGKNSRKWEKILSDWKAVMTFVFEELEKQGIDTTQPCDVLWTNVKRLKILDIKPVKNNIRCADRCITTVVKYIRKIKKHPS